MVIPESLLLYGIDVFLLIFVRITGLFVVSPIFGRENTPRTFKIGFSLLLSLIAINVVSLEAIDYNNNLFGYAAMVAKEFIVGLSIGYVGYLVFTSIYVAGQVIDMQIGFGAVNVIDPMSNIQIPLISNLYYMFTMLIFLMLNGHHILIRAIVQSYDMVPINTAIFGTSVLDSFVRLFGDVFLIALKISAPILAAILVANIILGLISKTVPQVNVFILGMPMKIAIGVAILMITLPMFASLVEWIIRIVDNEMFNLLKNLV